MSERDKLIAKPDGLEILDDLLETCEMNGMHTEPSYIAAKMMHKELRALAAQQPEAVEPVAYMIWAPFTGPAQFTTDKTAPIKTAQRADYTCTPLYAHASDFKDAYVGAREDLEVWKRRALAAEENNRQLLRALSEEVNSPMFLGEPFGVHFADHPNLDKGHPQSSAPADHTAADAPAINPRGQGNNNPEAILNTSSGSAVGVTPDLDAPVAHELYVRVASTPQDGSGGFGDFIEIEDAMGNGVSVPNQSGGNGTHLIGPLYSDQAITDLWAEVERAKTQRDEAWKAFTRLRRAYSMVRYPTLTEELRLLYDAADAVAAGKGEEKS